MKNKIVYIFGIILGIVLIGFGTYDIYKLISDDYIDTTGVLSYENNKPVIKYEVDSKSYSVKAKGFIIIPKKGTKVKMRYNKNDNNSYVINSGGTILPNILIGFILLIFSILSIMQRGIEIKNSKPLKIVTLLLCSIFALYENIILFNNVSIYQLVVFDLIFITLISYLVRSLKS
jgi:hypothetical protein